MHKIDIHRLCISPVSVSSELAKDSTAAPSSICKKLFGHNGEVEETAPDSQQLRHDSAIDLEAAYTYGKWQNSNPSPLFLIIFKDVLETLHHDPLNGVCSPSLLGSNGVCPLTVIATIPDICRHMSNLIVRAQHEVFLATNYWMLSEGSKIITNSLRELSRKCVAEDRKVVVKIMYDRGNVNQVVRNHQKVDVSAYGDPNGKIAIPKPEEIPNVSVEVQNYHRPALGTFHAKFMIVDRKIAVTQSNNIQDNDNLEMMAQFEGDIVDSLYDMALITWHDAMDPPLPCLAMPAVGTPPPTFETESFRALFPRSEVMPHSAGTGPSNIPGSTSDDSLKKVATHASQIEMAQHTSKDSHYDIDVASEVVRAVASLNPQSGETRIQSIARLLNGPAPKNASPSAPDIEPEDMMTPMIPITPHPPFPIALVNRPPYGSLSKHSLHTPQNVAWISAMRNAKSSIFIQTPDLNAQDLLPEILAACRRGVNVTYFYCLGYNDAGELLPGQGGHNDKIAHSLYNELEPQFHSNLDIFVYTAKDQIMPIHNKFKKRSCHIKLMIADGHIGIQGSGNQDTQSWYHSQEVNVMIDSSLVCGKWIEGIKQNENTHLYGKVQKEGEYAGCWIDPKTGKMADGAIGPDAGKFAWAKGVVGAVQRVRGVGGF